MSWKGMFGPAARQAGLLKATHSHGIRDEGGGGSSDSPAKAISSANVEARTAESSVKAFEADAKAYDDGGSDVNPAESGNAAIASVFDYATKVADAAKALMQGEVGKKTDAKLLGGVRARLAVAVAEAQSVSAGEDPKGIRAGLSGVKKIHDEVLGQAVKAGLKLVQESRARNPQRAGNGG